MRLFGKKKDEEVDDEELDKEELDRELPSKKFKDLAPKNKRKRKEPVKPWGKVERVVILTILLVTIFLSVLFRLSSGSDFNFHMNIFEKINLNNLNPFKGETIIVGNDSN